jgi:glycosyltransferase involved in cell wall biosynthesis
MKIAYFSDTFYPRIDGPSIIVQKLAQNFSKKGHQLMIFVPKYPDVNDSQLNWGKNVTVKRINSIPLVMYPNTRVSSPVSIRTFLSLIKFKPDIVHYHTEFTLGFAGMTVAKMLRKPLIGSFHTYYMRPEYLKMYGIKYGTDSIFKILRKQAIWFHNNADVLVTPSTRLKKDLLSWGYKKKISVIHNPITLEVKMLSKAKIENLRRQWNVNKQVLLYVGRVSKEKDPDTLIKAFHKLENKECSLLIVGDGPYRRNLEKLTKKLKISNRITFTGAIEHKQLMNSGIYQIADIFVTPSASENQPMTILEAMAHGLPIIGVNALGVPELVKSNGLLSEPGDVGAFAKNMQALLSNKKLRLQMGLKSQQMAKEFSVDKVVDKLETLYQKLIDDKKHKS